MFGQTSILLIELSTDGVDVEQFEYESFDVLEHASEIHWFVDEQF